MSDDEFIDAIERYSQDREMLIPREIIADAVNRISQGLEPVPECFRGRPSLQDAYDVALRLYKLTLN